MKDTSRMLISTIIAAALFLLMFLLLKWNLIFCILLCIGVYFGLFLLLKPKQKIAGISIEFIPEEEEIRKLLEDAQADFIEIDSAIKSISDSSVKVDAQTLYDTGKRPVFQVSFSGEFHKLATMLIHLPFITAIRGYSVSSM